MKPEDRMLFACARQVMLEEHRQAILALSQPSSFPWERVFRKAEQHGIAPLVYVNLCQRTHLDLQIPAPVIDHYHKLLLQNTIMKEQRARKLTEVLAHFRERSIDVLLFKGSALDLLVYENPALVTPRDIDLILRLARDDFSLTERRELMDYLHQTGIEYDFYEHHDMSINGTLPIDFARIWRDATQIDYRGQQVYTMCPEDLFLSICINSCRKRFFRLKSLMDIAETLRVIKSLQWDLMAEKAIAYGCQNIVYTALLVTERTLGCEIPESGLEVLKVDSVRAAMIRSVVSLLVRYASLPKSPDSARGDGQWPIDGYLILPYLSYQGYQVRHKLFNEILIPPAQAE